MSRSNPAADFADAIANTVADLVVERVAELLKARDSQPREPSTGPLYLSERQASARFTLHPKTLQAYRRNGGGPEFLRAGRKILYPVDAFERWLREGGSSASSASAPTSRRGRRAAAQEAHREA